MFGLLGDEFLVECCSDVLFEVGCDDFVVVVVDVLKGEDGRVRDGFEPLGWGTLASGGKAAADGIWPTVCEGESQIWDGAEGYTVFVSFWFSKVGELVGVYEDVCVMAS